jgi:HIT zinc finger
MNHRRLGLCEMCCENKAKYTCPKCLIHTCSLTCSKNHKKSLECDGVRDKTKYIPLKKMTPLDFMNDYYFLEEATRFTKTIKNNDKISVKRLNSKFTSLKKAAVSRNVKFFFLNSALTKRKQNLSKYDRNKDEIFWHVEVIFPSADFKTTLRINETNKIYEIVKNALEFHKDKKQLDFYRAQGMSKMRVLLKAEGLKKNFNRFYDLDVSKTLKSCLSNKVIVEYPTIHVILNYLIDNFETVDSDDESIEQEQKEFIKTLHEEVFTRKIQNPPLIVRPEEIPVIAKIVEDEIKQQQGKINSLPYQHLQHQQQQQCAQIRDISQVSSVNDEDDDCSDNEIAPENYFFV